MKFFILLVATQFTFAQSAKDELNRAINRMSNAGSVQEICETCGITSVGEDKEMMMCDQIGSGRSFLPILKNGSVNVELACAVADWRAKAMCEPEKCLEICPKSSGIEASCSKMSECSSQCATSKIINSINGKGCESQGPNYDKQCMARCSPLDGIAIADRERVVLQMYRNAVIDVKKGEPEFAEKVGPLMSELPIWLTCMNKVRENTNFEPMDRNFSEKCSNTAIGIGQVIEETFYGTLGVPSKEQARRCNDIVLEKIETCGGFKSHYYRPSLFKEKYGTYSVQQIFERRTFDTDLQVRSSLATLLNHMQDAKFNFDAALTGYFGQKDPAALRRIKSCVNTSGKAGR